MMQKIAILPHWGRCPAGAEGVYPAAIRTPSVSASRCHLPQKGRKFL